jgi:hypothetical protein
MNERKEAELLFLYRLENIEDALQRRSRLGMIDASGSLRLILLDGLLDKVNQHYKLNVEFIVQVQIDPTAGVDWKWAWLSPAPFSGQLETVSLSGFLRRRVARLEGLDILVRDVIRVCANSKGGVHFGEVKGARAEYERKLLDVDKRLNFGQEVEHSVSSLIGICRVALAGLAPLMVKIRTG